MFLDCDRIRIKKQNLAFYQKSTYLYRILTNLFFCFVSDKEELFLYRTTENPKVSLDAILNRLYFAMDIIVLKRTLKV